MVGKGEKGSKLFPSRKEGGRKEKLNTHGNLGWWPCIEHESERAGFLVWAQSPI